MRKGGMSRAAYVIERALGLQGLRGFASRSNSQLHVFQLDNLKLMSKFLTEMFIKFLVLFRSIHLFFWERHLKKAAWHEFGLLMSVILLQVKSLKGRS